MTTLLLLLGACGGEAPLPGDPLRIATGSLPDPVQGEAYRASIVASGGLRPYRLRIEDGELPPGLVLQGGLIVGTPSQLGRFEFTVAVSDGNLSSTFESFELTVRELPIPRLTVEVPATEVRGRTRLPVRVSDARLLRAVRIRLTWDDPSLELAEPAVRSSRDDLAVFWEGSESGIAIDAAFLGPTFDGGAELFELVLDATEATRIGVIVEIETLYADRHAFERARVGAAASVSEDPGETNESDASEGNAQ